MSRQLQRHATQSTFSHDALRRLIARACDALIPRESSFRCDRARVGHSLELVKVGQRVRWVNDRTHVTYVLTPLAVVSGDPKECRRFNLEATVDGKARKSESRACRTGDRTWSMK